MRDIPQVVQDVNVFIDGRGYLGVTKKLKIPTIEFEMLESKSALSTNYNMGVLKATEMEFTISKCDLNQFKAMGLNVWGTGLPFLFKASVHQSGAAKDKALALAVTGDIISWEMSDIESAKEVEITIKLCAHFLSLTINGVPMMLKDSKNMICILGGVDYMAQVRANLGE
ncbi:phage major tail tube protein [Campylobacter devanensis]|uniref:phage major tail tube protein n=1 Tax=Campylobacter devanensis TaxID=3161138 RepID=UPI000A34396D|nr:MULTISPECIES: phage major tail tube protein [unclassified Campylobacter]